MRVPQYGHLPSWQRFFAGVAIGAFVSWILFLIIFGEFQERQAALLLTQKAEIEQLNDRIKVLNEDNLELNKRNEERLTVQEISIRFTNEEELKLDSLKIHTLKKAVEEELTELIGDDIETVHKTHGLIMKTIENKAYIIDKEEYKLTVRHIYLYTKLELKIEITKV